MAVAVLTLDEAAVLAAVALVLVVRLAEHQRVGTVIMALVAVIVLLAVAVVVLQAVVQVKTAVLQPAPILLTQRRPQLE